MSINNTDKYEKYRPKKFLGQNFLVDENIARKIVDSLNIKDDDFILEIGPGHGALTKYFLESAKNYLAVEIDKSIAEKLRVNLFSDSKGKNINIIQKDFLKFDFEKDLKEFLPGRDKEIKISGNLPYNITTEVLFKLFENKDRVSSAVLMIQKEVAQRLIAKPNTKEYGILAVFTQYNSKVSILFNVPPTAFFPKPRVNSSVIEIKLKRDENKVKDYEIFRALVRESFGKRRKTMRNSLKDFFERKKINCGKIDFDFSRRPENLTIDEFVSLANDIQLIINN